MTPISPDIDLFAPAGATIGLRKNAAEPGVAVAVGAVDGGAADARVIDAVAVDDEAASPDDLSRGFLAGDNLAGRRLWHYQLAEKIGAGGMGVVYKAEHVWLGRTVAVKFLALDLRDNPAGVARFTQEALAVGALDHPNIVRASDAGAVGGVHFLVTEFIEGQNLAELARSPKGLSPSDACEIIRQAALGLEHAHEQGLVHRDIKPSNLIVRRDGVVKLLDFGLARIAAGNADLTTTGQLVGTLDYLAPEQATDPRHVDIRADIYALGCTLYFLLAGRAPFAGLEYSTAASKIRAHLCDTPPPLAARRGKLPIGLAACVTRMMAKSPADRFRTPAEVAAALAPFARTSELASLLGGLSPARAGRATQRDWTGALVDHVELALRAAAGVLHRSVARGSGGPAHSGRQRIFSPTGIIMLSVAGWFLLHFSCVPGGRCPNVRPAGAPFQVRRAEPAASGLPPGAAAARLQTEAVAAAPVERDSRFGWLWGWWKSPTSQRLDNPYTNSR